MVSFVEFLQTEGCVRFGATTEEHGMSASSYTLNGRVAFIIDSDMEIARELAELHLESLGIRSDAIDFLFI